MIERSAEIDGAMAEFVIRVLQAFVGLVLLVFAVIVTYNTPFPTEDVVRRPSPMPGGSATPRPHASWMQQF